MRYEVITKLHCLDNDGTDDFTERLFNEQNEKLEVFGFDFIGEAMTRINGGDVEINAINEAIQYLAIKDGIDLVMFENGNLGFVAYYNNYKDYLEILR